MSNIADSMFAAWVLVAGGAVLAASGVLAVYCLPISLGRRLTCRRVMARKCLDDCACAGGAVVFLLALQTVWQAHADDFAWRYHCRP